MRNVVSNSEVAHLWAQERQQSARNPQDNFYFNRATIYSYGSHFPIAQHYRLNGGDHKILYTTQGYSSTTAKHLNEVSGAIPGYIDRIDCLVVEGVEQGSKGEFSHRQNIREYAQRACHLIDKQNRARTADYTGEIVSVKSDFNKYVKYFKCKSIATQMTGKERKKLKYGYAKLEEEKYRETLKDLLSGEIRWENARILSEKEKQKILERKQAEAKKAQQKIQDWLSGKSNDTNPFYNLKTDMLRLVTKHEGMEGEKREVKIVQTSRGLDIKYQDAKRLYYIVDAVRKDGEDRRFNDLEVSGWNINSITKHGDIRAGCHFIPFEEAQKIALSENW